jgi:DNA-binding NarL/FixJ family response regulator
VQGGSGRRRTAAGRSTVAPPVAGPIRVVVADDAFLMREAIRRILEGTEEIQIAAICEDGDSAWAAVERESPDVVLVDVRMPPGGDDEGIRLAQRLRTHHPSIGVIVLSQYAEPQLGLDLLADGAQGRGYLLKERVRDRAELVAAIRVAAAGGTVIDPALIRLLLDERERAADSPIKDLTPREREVLHEMALGKSNGAIAETLVLTKRAVEKHVGSIFLKLGLEDEEVVSRRVAAVLMYLGHEAPAG